MPIAGPSEQATLLTVRMICGLGGGIGISADGLSALGPPFRVILENIFHDMHYPEIWVSALLLKSGVAPQKSASSATVFQ